MMDRHEKLERSARMHSLRSMISKSKRTKNLEVYRRNRKEYLKMKKEDLEAELKEVNKELSGIDQITSLEEV